MDKWLAMAGLLGLLGLALWVTYRQWILVDVDVPAWAWISMAFGVALSVLVGGGLMALIFYSSRKGYDEPPHKIEPDDQG
ncbi:MAG TPA: hypothetical protein VIY51_16110 [Xanthobacteraceae bacterium]